MPMGAEYTEFVPVEEVQPVVVAQTDNSVVNMKAAVVLEEPTNIELPYSVTGMRYVRFKEGDAKDGYIQHHPAPT